MNGKLITFVRARVRCQGPPGFAMQDVAIIGASAEHQA